MHDFSQPLGEAVKKARSKMRLTQEKTAELAETNVRTVSAIEREQSNTRMNILYPLVRKLRIDPNDIFYPEMRSESSVKHQFHVLIDDCTDEEAEALLKASETILDLFRSKDTKPVGKNKSLSPL